MCIEPICSLQTRPPHTWQRLLLKKTDMDPHVSCIGKRRRLSHHIHMWSQWCFTLCIEPVCSLQTRPPHTWQRLLLKKTDMDPHVSCIGKRRRLSHHIHMWSQWCFTLCIEPVCSLQTRPPHTWQRLLLKKTDMDPHVSCIGKRRILSHHMWSPWCFTLVT